MGVPLNHPFSWGFATIKPFISGHPHDYGKPQSVSGLTYRSSSFSIGEACISCTMLHQGFYMGCNSPLNEMVVMPGWEPLCGQSMK